ncbi:MAG: hypothetical protein RXP28_02080 [Nitrososphaeria archaeon]
MNRWKKGSFHCGYEIHPPPEGMRLSFNCVNYPALTGKASRFIYTLTCGILAKYFTIAEAFSSPGV